MIAAIGFLAGLIPHILDLFKEYKQYQLAKLDNEHELAIMQLQITLASQNLQNQMRETEIEGTVEALSTISKPFISGNKIIDAINNLIRPIIVFSFIGYYIWMQQYIITEYMTTELSLQVFIDIFWTEHEQAMLNAILVYYFGNFVRK